MASPEPGFFGRHGNVYVYVPNLIGYARVALCLGALTVAFESTEACVALYFASFVCDELDGRFARMLDQTSEFGKVLDMVTDRLATTGLCLVLSVAYPAYYLPLVLLVTLDIGSHWLQMYVGLLFQGGGGNHKDVSATANPLLRLYYTKRIFMGVCCVSVEVLYLCLLVLRDPAYAAWPFLPLPAALSGAVGRPAVPLAAVLAAAALPGWGIKQLANCSQLGYACDMCVEFDRARDAKKRDSKNLPPTTRRTRASACAQ